jgi:tRNA (mo5U34)-methyltransferase
MQRRGASEVLGIDILDPHQWDWPAGSDEALTAALGARKARGRGFELVNEALGSPVKRRELSVYDLDPDDVGEFDLVYLGSLLLHLRDPVGGLMAVRKVCRETLIVCDAIDPGKTRRFRRQPVASLDGRGRPWWWKGNLAALARMVEAAGFELTEPPRKIRMKRGAGQPRQRFSLRAMADGTARDDLAHSWFGDPHGIVVARPIA